jgi:N-formylglutamate deformylase
MPLLLDSPHSGTAYPEDFGYCVPLAALRDAEDTHVHTLYAPWVAAGATLVAANFPRSYVDVNRAADDIDTALIDGQWPKPIAPTRKSELGKGLVWRCLDDGRPLYDRKLTVAQIERRIERYWQPYWHTLEQSADALHAAHDRLYHINCHSMPSRGAIFAFDQPAADLPDFVVGDRDGSTCAPDYAMFVMQALRDLGYEVGYNAPYKGVEIVRRLGRPQQQRHSIQLEVNRKLYLNEQTREMHSGASKLIENLQTLCQKILKRFC